MARVTESMKDLFNYLPKKFPLKVVIFSKQAMPDFDSEHFLWIPWSDSNEKIISKEGTEEYKNLLLQHFGKEKIKLVIGDAFTLRYWEDFDVPFCYDAHYLEHPFFKAFHSTPDIYSLDRFSSNPICKQLNTSEVMAYKREARFLRRCTSFIANSNSTAEHFQKYYDIFTANRPIRVVPVSTSLTSSVTHEKTAGLYYSGRFHPQKGLHFLLNRKCTKNPISFRGFDSSLISIESQNELQKSNHVVLSWTDDLSILANEIQRAKVVLFPSIYEPWGLALQEALSMGKICVANRCESGHEEQISHGENGFLIDMKNSDWENELEEIYNLPADVCRRISQNALSTTPLGHDHRLKKFAEVLKEFETL